MLKKKDMAVCIHTIKTMKSWETMWNELQFKSTFNNEAIIQAMKDDVIKILAPKFKL